METADTRRRGVRVLLPLALGIAAVLALAPVAASGATVSAAWSAKIGSAGVNGKATISAYTTGTGVITLKLAKLRASTLLPVVLHKGTCSAVGTVLLKLPSIKTTRTGTASRTSSLTASQVSSYRCRHDRRQDRDPDRDRLGPQVRGVQPACHHPGGGRQDHRRKGLIRRGHRPQRRLGHELV